MSIATEAMEERYDARIAELEAECDRLRAALEESRENHRAANIAHDRLESRAEALQARVAELERDVESSDAGRDSAFDLIEQKNNELDAAHEALETSKARVAELEGRLQQYDDVLCACAGAINFEVHRDLYKRMVAVRQGKELQR